MFVPATGRTETEWQKALKKKIRDKRSKNERRETGEGLGTQREGTGGGKGRGVPRRWTKEERETEDGVGGYDRI